MGDDRFSLLLYRVSLCGSLLGGAALLYFLGGLAGLIGNPALNLVPAAAALLAALFFVAIFFGVLPEKNRLALLVWLLILALLAMEIILGLVPPAARDELSHHLAIPRLYVKAGRILPVPFAPYSYYPMLLEMLYTPWVRWGWDSVPKLIHGLYGLLTALAIYAYLSRRLSPVYGLLGFLFFVSTPAVLRLSNWGYVDLGLVFYSAVSLLCLLRWAEGQEKRIANSEWRIADGGRRTANDKRSIRNLQSAIRDIHCRWFLLAGLSAGFAVATKPNGLLALLLLCLALAYILGGEKKRGVAGTASRLFLFLVLAALPVGPWLVKNFVWTGNPFFPLLGNFFGGRGGGVSVGAVTGLGIFAKRAVLYGENLWQMIALPLRVFFTGQDNNPQYFDGVLNPMLILFLPWAFKGKWPEEKKLFFAFALLYFFYAMFLTDLRIRYILPIVPPLVLLLVYGIHNVYLRIARPVILYAVVVALLALNGLYLGDYFHTVSPVGYLTGREARDAYLARMLPEYPAIRYINQNLPAEAKIYFLFIGRRVYYCERDYIHDSDDTPSLFLQMIQGARSEEDVAVGFRQMGVTHLLVRLDLFLKFLNDNLTRPQKEMVVRFQARYLRLLYDDRRAYAVYEVHG